MPKNSPLTSVRELPRRRIAFPEDISYAARAAPATLRDNGIDIAREKSVQHFRDQAAIDFLLEAGLADVGAVMSYSGVGRDWEKKRGRVLLDGPRKPYMPMVASPRVSAREVAQLRAALVALEQTPAGQAVLKKVGIPGFEVREAGEVITLLKGPDQ